MTSTSDPEPESEGHPRRLEKIRSWKINGHMCQVTPGWTVIEPRWDIDWVFKIVELEKRQDRAICGFPTKRNTPCLSKPMERDIDKPGDIGRCHFHKSGTKARAKAPDMSIKVISSELPADPETAEEQLLASPAYQLLSTLADNVYSGCNPCVLRLKCKQFDNGATCAKERVMFETLIVPLILEHNITMTIDKIMAFKVVTDFVQIIKTHVYEQEYGTIKSIQDGMTTLRLQLSRQLLQYASKLGIDRKSRLIINQGGVRSVAQKTLSEILTGMDSEIQIDTASVSQISVKHAGPPMPRGDRKFIDLDGTEIIRGDYTIDDITKEDSTKDEG